MTKAGYADYEYYTRVYCGSAIAKDDFPRLSRLASAYVDGLVQVQDSLQNAVQDAVCAVAEAWQTSETGGDKVSENNDGWSVQYASHVRSKGQRLYEAAALFLTPTGLLNTWL